MERVGWECGQAQNVGNTSEKAIYVECSKKVSTTSHVISERESALSSLDIYSCHSMLMRVTTLEVDMVFTLDAY